MLFDSVAMSEKRNIIAVLEKLFSKKKVKDASGNESIVSICALCGPDGKPLKCSTQFNLSRHLTLKHKQQAEEHGLISNEPEPAEAAVATTSASKKSSKVWVKIDRNVFVTSTMQWITEGNVSLNFFSKKCVNRVMHPLEDALKLPHINRRNVVARLDEVVHKVENQIMHEISGKMVCIKADTASRKGRCVLGINVQFIENGRVVVRTLAMVERVGRNTAENLCVEILKVLDHFKIKIEQVYSITTDNGSNFLKTARLMKEKQLLELSSCEARCESASESESDKETDDEEEVMAVNISM